MEIEKFVTIWRRAVAWSPLGALLLMGVFSVVTLQWVVNCNPNYEKEKDIGDKRIVERVCIPHRPNVVPRLADTQLEMIADQPFNELNGRLAWSISMLFFTLTITATFLIILRTINVTLRAFRLLHRVVIVLSVAAAGGVAYYLLPSGQSFKFNNQFLKPTVFRVASAAELFVDFVENMAPIALVGLAVAVSLILYRSSGMIASPTELSISARVNALADSQNRVRLLLYVGAIALVAGTLQASALYTWAMSMLTVVPDVAYYSNVSEIPQAMGILNGAFYSIFLAGIFVPAIAQLRSQAHQLAEEAMPTGSAAERNKWLEEKAIEGTFPRQFISALAVIAPLIAGGPLIALIELIGR